MGPEVYRHTIFFDSHFHAVSHPPAPALRGEPGIGRVQGSKHDAAAAPLSPRLTDRLPAPSFLLQGINGIVVYNATGPLYDSQLPTPINLTAWLPTPGWHTLMVVGKTIDPLNRGVQTSELLLNFELVPPCPPTTAPFTTHVWQDWWGQFTTGNGRMQQTSGSDSLWLPVPSPLMVTFAVFTFDLSFLSVSASPASATLYLSLWSSTMPSGTVGLTAWDATKSLSDECHINSGVSSACSSWINPAMPCLGPVCSTAVQVRDAGRGVGC